MIYLTVRGGIGNQLFQYAFARSISIDTNQNIVIDNYSINKDNQRTLKLNEFNIPKNNLIIDSSFKAKKYNPDFNIILKIVTKLSSKKNLKTMKKKNIIIYSGLTFCKFTFKKNKDIHLFGYFQSEKYFEKHKNKIKEEFQIKNDSKYNELINKINSNPNSVCLHYRKGDYKLEKNRIYQVCDKNYYIRAMSIMKSKLKDAKFYIFSDDIEEVKKEFGNMENVIYVSDIKDDINELCIMSKCNNFIMSNSSFSWWAQYLSNNDGKLVIAPNKWTIDGRKNDIYMENWIKL